MDFHLMPGSNKEAHSTTYYQKLFKRFIPIFGLSLFLPFLLFFAISPPKFDFTPRANQPQELRLWFEPSSVVAKVGQPTKVKLMGLVENDLEPIHSISINLNPTKNVSVTPSQIVYSDAFTGRTILQVIEITPTAAGEFSIQIPKDKVVTSVGEVNIITSPLQMIVEN